MLLLLFFGAVVLLLLVGAINTVQTIRRAQGVINTIGSRVQGVIHTLYSYRKGLPEFRVEPCDDNHDLPPDDGIPVHGTRFLDVFRFRILQDFSIRIYDSCHEIMRLGFRKDRQVNQSTMTLQSTAVLSSQCQSSKLINYF